MVTKEKILTSSEMAKFLHEGGSFIKGVLSPEEAAKRMQEFHTLITVYSRQLKVYFHTDDYAIVSGVPEMMSLGFMPASSKVPLRVAPREGLESGYCITLEDFELAHHKGERRLETVDELLEVLNHRNVDQGERNGRRYR